MTTPTLRPLSEVLLVVLNGDIDLIGSCQYPACLCGAWNPKQHSLSLFLPNSGKLDWIWMDSHSRTEATDT